MKSVAVLAVGVSVLIGGLSGCRAGDGEPSPTPTIPPASASVNPTASPVPSSTPTARDSLPSSTATSSSPASTLVGPVIVTTKKPNGVVGVGRTIVFKLPGDPSDWLVYPVGDPAPTILAELTPGTATTNWGAETVAEGAGVYNASNRETNALRTFVVTVVAPTAEGQGAFPADD